MVWCPLSFRRCWHLLCTGRSRHHLSSNILRCSTNDIIAWHYLWNDKSQDQHRCLLQNHCRVCLGRQSSSKHLVLQPWLHLRHQSATILPGFQAGSVLRSAFSRPHCHILANKTLDTSKTAVHRTARSHLHRDYRPSRRSELGAHQHQRCVHQRRCQRLYVSLLTHTLQH
jgi:hypothetical protein